MYQIKIKKAETFCAKQIMNSWCIMMKAPELLFLPS